MLIKRGECYPAIRVVKGRTDIGLTPAERVVYAMRADLGLG